jgi:drug/metabolite transporter (DMT)-like permease
MWLILSFISALLLGSYDVSKKISLQNNAVIPVLFSSVIISCILLLPFVILSCFTGLLNDTSVYLPSIDFQTHLLLILKAVIVLTSWLFAYFAIKHLPITIASPIKSTQPVWVVLGGVLIFGEKLNGFQTAGVIVTMVSFLLFSFAGKHEGYSMTKSKWLWFIIIATLTGAVSGLYDKYLLKSINHMSVLVYYTYYQAIIMSVITLLLWYPTRKRTTPFSFRWSIVFISLLLLSADFAYFYALSIPDSMISVVATIRRSGVIVPFIFGGLVLHDKNMKLKMLDLIGVMLGMVLLYLGSR